MIFQLLIPVFCLYFCRSRKKYRVFIGLNGKNRGFIQKDHFIQNTGNHLCFVGSTKTGTSTTAVKTGDATNVAGWGFALAASAIAAAAGVAGKRKKED